MIDRFENILRRTGILQALSEYVVERKYLDGAEETLVIPAANYCLARDYLKGAQWYFLKLGEEATDRPCMIKIHPDGIVDLRDFFADYRHEYDVFWAEYEAMTPEARDESRFEKGAGSTFWSAEWRESSE